VLLEESRDLHMAERDRLLRALKDYPGGAPFCAREWEASLGSITRDGSTWICSPQT
jgi:hypothetical protein